jgi:hypothetical protein
MRFSIETPKINHFDYGKVESARTSRATAANALASRESTMAKASRDSSNHLRKLESEEASSEAFKLQASGAPEKEVIAAIAKAKKLGSKEQWATDAISEQMKAKRTAKAEGIKERKARNAWYARKIIQDSNRGNQANMWGMQFNQIPEDVVRENNLTANWGDPQNEAYLTKIANSHEMSKDWEKADFDKNEAVLDAKNSKQARMLTNNKKILDLRNSVIKTRTEIFDRIVNAKEGSDEQKNLYKRLVDNLTPVEKKILDLNYPDKVELDKVKSYYDQSGRPWLKITENAKNAKKGMKLTVRDGVSTFEMGGPSATNKESKLNIKREEHVAKLEGERNTKVQKLPELRGRLDDIEKALSVSGSGWFTGTRVALSGYIPGIATATEQHAASLIHDYILDKVMPAYTGQTTNFELKYAESAKANISNKKEANRLLIASARRMAWLIEEESNQYSRYRDKILEKNKGKEDAFKLGAFKFNFNEVLVKSEVKGESLTVRQIQQDAMDRGIPMEEMIRRWKGVIADRKLKREGRLDTTNMPKIKGK